MDAFNDQDSPDDSSPPRNHKRGLSTEEDSCIICLQRIQDRTILPQCSHDSQCFSCLLEWTKHSVKCPLCVSDIGPFLIHKVRSKHDYQRYFISPALSPTALSQSRSLAERIVNNYQLQHEEERRRDEMDAAILRRRHVYNNSLFAKHVASNRYTGYVPHPTPAQISASVDLQGRARAFLRRELRVWINLDIEFLTNYIIALIKMLDLRSEAGIKLLSDLMDPGTPHSEGGRKPNTEHLAHELYSFLRSPYKQVEAYDETVQYDASNFLSRSHKLIRQSSSHHPPVRKHSMSPVRIQSKRTNDRLMREISEHENAYSQDQGPSPTARSSRPSSPSPSLHKSELRFDTSGFQQSQVANGHEEYPQSEDRICLSALISQSSVMHTNKADPSNSQAVLMKRIRSEISRQREMNIAGHIEHEPDAGSSASTSTSAAPAPGHLTASRREELLAKLNSEKVRAENSRTTGGDNVNHSPAINATLDPGGIQIRGAAAKARDSMEKRLRSQALLRVKLAREKCRLLEAQKEAKARPASPPLSPDRMDMSTSMPGSSKEPEAVDDKTILQHKLRERLLKERLLLARMKSSYA